MQTLIAQIWPIIETFFYHRRGIFVFDHFDNLANLSDFLLRWLHYKFPHRGNKVKFTKEDQHWTMQWRSMPWPIFFFFSWSSCVKAMISPKNDFPKYDQSVNLHNLLTKQFHHLLANTNNCFLLIFFQFKLQLVNVSNFWLSVTEWEVVMRK